MFTGLIEDVGRVSRADRRGDAVILVITGERIAGADMALGESIAVNGVCLTVTAKSRKQLTVLAGAETLRCTTLGELSAGSRVNLERALKLSERLGGHIVTGHVDATGELLDRRQRDANLELTVAAPAEILRYVVAKGSIAVDGVSLTVNRVDQTGFQVALIPHTVTFTALGAKQPGDRVNLETDIIAKHIDKLTAAARAS
ncbi:MAG TPA: riboflavin synthase [Kofleriaceae bacterium]|nr:riboflavin synthase [Kofleriaceae bacterium]